MSPWRVPGARRQSPTDSFGDFEFEGLPGDTAFKVTVSSPGYETREFEVKTYVSVYLGDIVLKRT